MRSGNARRLRKKLKAKQSELLPNAASDNLRIDFIFNANRTLNLYLQTESTIAETLYDIDDSNYDYDVDANALIPLVRTKHQALTPTGHTHVELIDVKCDAKAGMLVTVEFEEVFSGIIYSQGYYSDPKCR